MIKRTCGRETWHRILEWDKSSGDAERLAAQILALDGFTEIDPSHPLGGPDSKRDIKLSRNGKIWIAAVYFPRGQKSLSCIRKKYNADAKGVEKHKAEGMAFITNQELKLGERELLQKEHKFKTEIYHLERLASILDRPMAYGIRLEFLDIEMTKEEQLSALSYRDDLIRTLLCEKINETKEMKRGPIEVEPELISAEQYTIYNWLKPKLHFCSSCGFGYKIKDIGHSSISSIYYGSYSITCPKCGNTEQYNKLV